MMTTEEQLAAIPQGLPVPEQLDRALGICAFARGLPSPDYGSFCAWIGPRMMAEQQIIQADPASVTSLSAAGLLRLRQLGRALKASPNADPAELNKLKLLYFVFSGEARSRDVAKTLMTVEVPQHLTEDLYGATPAELRLRLFAAVARGHVHDAAFIMGRLDPASLDEGEHDYLHALVCFKSGDLDGAVRLAAKVPLKSPDGARAAYLRAKANAMRGSTDAARSALTNIGSALSTCQWLHLMEVAGYNSDPASAQAIVEGLMPTLGTIAARDPGYGEWAKFHVHVLIGAMERLDEIEDSLAAEATAPQLELSEDLFLTDPVLKKAQVALMLDTTVGLGAPPTHLIGLVRPLLRDSDREAFTLIFEALFRLKQHDIFMENFAPYWKEIKHTLVADSDLIGLAFQAALHSGHRLTDHLGAALSEANAQALRVNTRRKLLADRLTPMGRQSYLGAAAALDRALAEEEIWRDCGLIALGFFRVLELELNERLVRPVAKSLDFALMRAVAHSLGDRARGWLKRIDRLEDSIGSQRRGLMFCHLKDLLTAALGTDRPAEAQLRKMLLHALEHCLTVEGRSALREGRLADIISDYNVRRCARVLSALG